MGLSEKVGRVMAASDAWLEATDERRTSLSILGLPALITEPLLSLLSGDERPKSEKTMSSVVLRSIVGWRSSTVYGSVAAAGLCNGGGSDIRNRRLEISREIARVSDVVGISGTLGSRMWRRQKYGFGNRSKRTRQVIWGVKVM